MSNEIQPVQFKPCPECGGERIAASTSRWMFTIQPTKHFISVTPDITSGFKALVCMNCGYTALYVIDIKSLLPEG